MTKRRSNCRRKPSGLEPCKRKSRNWSSKRGRPRRTSRRRCRKRRTRRRRPRRRRRRRTRGKPRRRRRRRTRGKPPPRRWRRTRGKSRRALAEEDDKPLGAGGGEREESCRLGRRRTRRKPPRRWRRRTRGKPPRRRRRRTRRKPPPRRRRRSSPRSLRPLTQAPPIGRSSLRSWPIASCRLLLRQRRRLGLAAGPAGDREIRTLRQARDDAGSAGRGAARQSRERARAGLPARMFRARSGGQRALYRQDLPS